MSALRILRDPKLRVSIQRLDPTQFPKPIFHNQSMPLFHPIFSKYLRSRHRDEQGGFQELSTLLREQNKNLDLLIKKTAALEAASEGL